MEGVPGKFASVAKSTLEHAIRQVCDVGLGCSGVVCVESRHWPCVDSATLVSCAGVSLDLVDGHRHLGDCWCHRSCPG